jgi:sugar lactone lactonase YvrE
MVSRFVWLAAWLTTVISAFPDARCVAAQGIDGLQSPFATEPGVRCRSYQIDSPVTLASVVDPGQSANHDVTIDGLSSGPPELPPEDPPVERQATIHWFSGWLRIDRPGRYQFEFKATATCRLSVNGTRCLEHPASGDAVSSPIELSPGWQPFDLWMMVNAAEKDELAVNWQLPEKTGFEPIPDARFRAPAFRFRPVQPGLKRLAGPGDRPGLGQKLAGIHPGYTVTDIRPPGMEMPVGGLGWLPDGRLIVARFDARTLKAPHPAPQPNGEIWLIYNPAAEKPADIRGVKIAHGLFEPSGVCVVGNSFYVSQRNNVLRFEEDHSRRSWRVFVVAGGWQTNDFHQISAGLLHRPGPVKGHPGFLWMARSPGLGLQKNPPNHGSVWKIDLSRQAGQNVEPLTGGHRTPNGIAFGPENELFVIDNQGEWTPANELNHVQQGKFYGFYQPHDPPEANASPFQPPDPDAPFVEITQPAVQLPQDEIANSPTQPLMFPPGHQFAGQLALPDMRYGGINRVWLEKVEGVWQGCVMRFTQGLSAGPNRMLFGPDGEIYVGGIGGQHASTWYWLDGHDQPTFQSLERLTPTGATAFEIDHVRATAEGLEVFFTEPVETGWLADPADFLVRQWTYRATAEYGGPKLDESVLTISSCTPSADGRAVQHTIPGRKPGYVLHLRTDPVSTTGNPIWSGDVWYTLNRLPGPR